MGTEDRTITADQKEGIFELGLNDEEFQWENE